MNNIYAYTGLTPAIGYVGYISINEREHGVEFSIRTQGENPSLGIITLTKDQCRDLASKLFSYLQDKD